MFEPGKGDQGRFVCQMMAERGVSSADMAEKLYVTESTISKWRRGKSDPSREKIPAIARLLGITETEIYRATLLSAEETLEERIAADIERLRRATGRTISCVFGLSVFFGAFFSSFSIAWLFDPSIAPQPQKTVWALFMIAFMVAGGLVAVRSLKDPDSSKQ